MSLHNERYVDRLIDECISTLASGDYRRGAESLQEFAHMWAKAGFPISSWRNMRTFIVCKAQEINPLCRMFLEVEEQNLQNKRRASDGKVIIH